MIENPVDNHTFICQFVSTIFTSIFPIALNLLDITRFPLHKIITAQLGKKLLTFYRNRRSFSACTRIPIVTQRKPVHNFHYMSFSLIFPFKHRFSKWFLYFRFTTKIL